MSKRNQDIAEKQTPQECGVQIINLTPDDIHFYAADGTTLVHTFPKSGSVLYLDLGPFYTQDVFSIQVLGASGPFQLPCATHTVPHNLEFVPRETPDFGRARGVIVSPSVGEFLTHCGAFQGGLCVIGADVEQDSVVCDENGNVKGVRRFISYKR